MISIRKTAEDLEQDAWYEAMEKDSVLHSEHPFLWLMQDKVAMLRFSIFGLFICWMFGHDLESDDFATPDSGYMGGHCKRCPFEYGGYLY